jgi:hypothetical protein
MKQMPREIQWPGNQLNDITKFREDCYKKCHENNPTDSGWYEKTDQCGMQCYHALKQFEYLQGKNPCELRLQAPVFWFNNNDITEQFSTSYSSPYSPSSSCSSCIPQSNMINLIYITLFLVLIFLIFIYLMLFIFKKK